MPTSAWKNVLYRAALPLLSPSPAGRMTHRFLGAPLAHLSDYEALLRRHHVLGASLLLISGDEQRALLTSVSEPAHPVSDDTLFRVASITKMATALATLRIANAYGLSLDTPAADVLPPEGAHPALEGVTLRHLLSHTSGLRDTPAYDAALRQGQPFTSVLSAPGVHAAAPGKTFSYCNFAFGLLGCVIEHVTGQTVEEAFREYVFAPLGMNATLDGSTLDESRVMPISRVLPYRKGTDVAIPKLGRIPLTSADPLRHFGHTAGSMYADAVSVAALLRAVSAQTRLCEVQAHYGAISPTLHYGCGMLIVEDRSISPDCIIGHQGFAYGCVDGAFMNTATGDIVVFLNGGASEARSGRLGLVNRDVMRYAFGKEIPAWK